MKSLQNYIRVKTILLEHFLFMLFSFLRDISLILELHILILMFREYLFKTQVDKNKNPPLWRFSPNCEFLHLFEVYIAPALHLNRDKLFMPAIGAGTGWDGGASSLPNFCQIS